DGDHRLAGKTPPQLGDQRLCILDGTGVIGLQQAVGFAAAAAKMHQYRLVPLALQMGKQPLGIVGVNAPLQAVKQHYQWPLPLADVTAPGEIDEVSVCQFKTFWNETGGGSSQPLWQYGLQMGI